MSTSPPLVAGALFELRAQAVDRPSQLVAHVTEHDHPNAISVYDHSVSDGTEQLAC